jgi:apolipoprotein N-acyltransferase
MTPLGRRSRRLALVAHAIATFLAFPHELPVAGSIDLGMLFVWLVPATLVLGIDGLAPGRAARGAFLASLAGHAFLFHWFFVVTVVYGGMPWGLGLLAPLLPALYVSLFTAAFAAIWAWLGSRSEGVGAIVLGAALWVTLDWVRAHFLGGFPWATLGYALHLDLPLLGITRWTGVYGLSFVAVALGLALARALPVRGRREVAARRVAGGVAIGVLLAHGLGLLLQSAELGIVEEVRIAAIQGNIDQREKWSEDRRERILETYTRSSEEAAALGAQWIVWPETAVPGLLEADPALSARIGRLVRRSRADFIVGGMGITPDASGRRILAFFDSAFILDRRGRLVDRYDKTQLVPFGEFVPLRGLLGHVFQALATGMASNDVTPGRAPRVSLIDGGPNARPPLRVGIPICYELIFPHLVRRFGAEGAGVLLAITNDAWYGRTGAPHQFLAMTALRAAENGRWVVRAANTGISAIIDARGRVREQTSLFEREVLVADVPVVRAGGLTFYARYGDVFAWICLGLVLSRMAWALINGVRIGLARRREGRSR